MGKIWSENSEIIAGDYKSESNPSNLVDDLEETRKETIKNIRMISSYYKYIISTILISLIILTPRSLNAQNDNVKKHPNYQSLNLSYIIGGQVYNDNFLYNPGYSIKASFGKEINSDIAAGVGVGYMPLTKETFLPLYIEILGRKKKKDNTPFISFQGGYSIGWRSSTSSNHQYDLDGGLFINAGLGRRIKVNEMGNVIWQHLMVCSLSASRLLINKY